MHLIWSSEVKCVVTVWFLWSFWYILSNGVGDVTSRWRHLWFTSQHQSDLKYITHNSGSHYCFYYRSHQHTRTRNKNIYVAIKDYPQIRVWSYLPQVVHSFWEQPICLFIIPSSLFTTLHIFLNRQKQCVYRSQAHHFVASWMSYGEGQNFIECLSVLYCFVPLVFFATKVDAWTYYCITHIS